MDERKTAGTLSDWIKATKHSRYQFDLLYDHIKRDNPNDSEADICFKVYLQCHDMIASSLSTIIDLEQRFEPQRKKKAALKAISENKGIKTAAAKDLGVTVRTLHRWLKY